MEFVVGAGLLLANLVQSAPLTSASVANFAQSLTGSVLFYNVSGEPRERVTPAFGLWTQLEVRPSMQLSCALLVCKWLKYAQQDGRESKWIHYDMRCRMGLTHL